MKNAKKIRQDIIAVNVAQVYLLVIAVWLLFHGEFLAALIFVGFARLFESALPVTRKNDDE
ncbi:hypothetical protein C8E02_2129 [Vogesella indigofera]|uniref:Uncharacterized protein n=1 Tax=Vogesella indigofera TaxID=45465 RepID=A0A495BAU7_VOGIN|nr:hypothetical protein [Vogesella indigofera]RKQ57830.1 hypothetical protein C8E02_2129 [Vogesella indigofera]